MVESAMNRNSCSKNQAVHAYNHMNLHHFPHLFHHYLTAISLPITLKALSITDLSHVSRRSANLLNRCPTPIIRSVSLKVRIKLLHPFPLASHFSVLTEKPEACSVELFTRCFHFWKHHKLRNIIYFSHLLQFPKINWCTSHQPISFSVMLPSVAYLGRYSYPRQEF